MIIIKKRKEDIKMEQVYILFWRLYDPYGCLEDNYPEIIGVFTTEEEANKHKEEFIDETQTMRRFGVEYGYYNRFGKSNYKHHNDLPNNE